MNKQWEMEFDEVLKGALCQYRDRMLAEAELQEGERFPVSREFYRKIAALSGVSTIMGKRRKRYERKKVFWRGFAKVVAAAVLVTLLTVNAEVLRLPMPITVDASESDFVLEWHPDYLYIRCKPLSEEELAQTEVREPEEFVLGYVPEGFVLKEEEHNPGSTYYLYRDGEGSFVFLTVTWRNSNSRDRMFSGGGMRVKNEHAGFYMTSEDGTELIWAESDSRQNGHALMWTRNNCEFNLYLATDRADIGVLELYRSVGLKEEKNEKK